jgi:hypothetical protein
VRSDAVAADLDVDLREGWRGWNCNDSGRHSDDRENVSTHYFSPVAPSSNFRVFESFLITLSEVQVGAQKDKSSAPLGGS